MSGVRELKHLGELVVEVLDLSHPLRVRELKRHSDGSDSREGWSHPLRVRELKLHHTAVYPGRG